MKNLLAGIRPAIYRPFTRKRAKGAQKYEAKKITLKYDRRHNNKRDWEWWAKKTGFRFREWWEHL